MPQSSLTGSRIRHKRLEFGLKQAVLAQNVGISAAYLNLIEHNKRRIGGKLLLDLARELKVEAASLSEGAQADLLTALHDAAHISAGAELARIDEFAGCFPGWAKVISAQHEQIERLKRIMSILTDRITHDPALSTSLHEVLSTAAAIRSTASILADGQVIEPERQARFQQNLLEDAIRLSDGAGALVSYLDASNDANITLQSPQEELESYLATKNYHLPDIEAGIDSQSKGMLADYEAKYRMDAEKLPLSCFQAAMNEGHDPIYLATKFGVDLATVLRRIASLPLKKGRPPVGLVIADGAGAMIFRKPIKGFTIPQFGAACPLWPLYQAMLRPQIPLRGLVQQAGPDAPRFLTFAIAQPRAPVGFDGVQLIEATMLIVAQNQTDDMGRSQPIGPSCRVCAQPHCAARREISILTRH